MDYHFIRQTNVGPAAIDRDSGEAIAISSIRPSVRLSVRLFTLYLVIVNRHTFQLQSSYVYSS